MCKKRTENLMYTRLFTEMIAKIGGHLKEQQRSQVEDIIAEAAMEGNIEKVKSIIRQQPSAVYNDSS